MTLLEILGVILGLVAFGALGASVKYVLFGENKT